MKLMTSLAALAFLACAPAFAQSQASQPQTTAPPGGSYQGYPNSRSTPDQTAQLPEPKTSSAAQPGHLRKFNSNSGYGPEVQFEVDRREQAQKKVTR